MAQIAFHPPAQVVREVIVQVPAKPEPIPVKKTMLSKLKGFLARKS